MHGCDGEPEQSVSVKYGLWVGLPTVRAGYCVCIMRVWYRTVCAGKFPVGKLFGFFFLVLCVGLRPACGTVCQLDFTD